MKTLKSAYDACGRLLLTVGLAWAVAFLLLGPAASMALAQVSPTAVHPSRGGGGSDTSANNTWTGIQTFIDDVFFVVDNVDNTKKIAFQASGITTGTARTYTMPDANGSVPLLSTNNTWTGANTFGGGSTTIIAGSSGSVARANDDGRILFGTANNADLRFNTTETPDTFFGTTPSLSNSWNLAEIADVGFDFNNGPCGTAACTNPQYIVHDKDQNVTNYQAIGLSGLSGKFVVTLVEASATAVVQIPVAAEAGESGQFLYTVYATDGSTPQVRSGRVLYSVVNDGGVETCLLGTPEELDNTPGASTLTATIACDTAPANAVNLTINATSSLTQTTLEAYGQVLHVGAGELLPQ